MRKEEYLLEKEDIKNRIQAEKDHLKELDSKYIRANLLYSIRERVKIVTPPYKYWNKMTEHTERYAYVIGYEINYSGDVIPILKKEKKDGTMGQIKDYFNSNTSYIERITE